MSYQINPCYFCQNPKPMLAWVEGSFKARAVCCYDCGAKGPAVENIRFDGTTGTNISKEECDAQAVDEWNNAKIKGKK